MKNSHEVTLTMQQTAVCVVNIRHGDKARSRLQPNSHERPRLDPKMLSRLRQDETQLCLRNSCSQERFLLTDRQSVAIYNYLQGELVVVSPETSTAEKERRRKTTSVDWLASLRVHSQQS